MRLTNSSSPFSSMMNFTFFDNSNNINQSQELERQEKHKIWKENTSLLYDNIMTHIMEWPSLTIEWMKAIDSEMDEETEDVIYNDKQDSSRSEEIIKNSILLGTHTSGNDQDYIIIMDVFQSALSLPPEQRVFETHKDFAGFSQGLKVSQNPLFKQRFLIPHEGEVNRVLHMPTNTSIIASKAINGNVNVYNLSNYIEQENTLDVLQLLHKSGGPEILDKNPAIVLSGHELEGWALNWSMTKNGYLASGSDDEIICVWDISSNINSSKTLSPLIMLKGHQKSVQDLIWHPSNENILLSVGDDGQIILWDIRESSFPCCSAIVAADENMRQLSQRDGAENTTKLSVVASIINSSSCSYSFSKYGSSSINNLNTITINPFQTNIIAVGGSDPTIGIFDIRNLQKRLHSMHGHNGQINRLHFLIEDEGLLASASSDMTISIWDLKKIGMEQRLDEIEDGVPELVFTHSGHTSPISDFSCMLIDNFSTTSFVSVSEDNYLHIWNPSETIFFSDDEDEEFERIKNIQVE
ncbi:uncharacterized protein CMU_028680 [Cryptosporidium muris RN66]|uniref:Histone-binding protein RBBP4-like N-terminal domain-containing protein n=1 Tax=Cryptosporidium muris (strain RN66) TaxID=441375 RepID=B6AHV3_CRYMR|nr:uncharacterized protein CMU_028680 [Cryptosporidium muris RN66]EEA07794.1 hypothetical protein, conserved [Cryptosporidium muris RN66]|eukprot:XP_002142143.1 hypothetical protein [Cryptosporidium muris RN66]